MLGWVGMPAPPPPQVKLEPAMEGPFVGRHHHFSADICWTSVGMYFTDADVWKLRCPGGDNCGLRPTPRVSNNKDPMALSF